MSSLFHATFPSALGPIMNIGLAPKTTHYASKLLLALNISKLVNGVSFTRSMAFAKEWGCGIILEVEKDEIRRHHRLIPVNYYCEGQEAKARWPGGEMHHRNEFEEFVVTSNNIHPKYIKRIHINKKLAVDDVRYTSTGKGIVSIREYVNEILVKKLGESRVITYG